MDRNAIILQTVKALCLNYNREMVPDLLILWQIGLADVDIEEIHFGLKSIITKRKETWFPNIAEFIEHTRDNVPAAYKLRSIEDAKERTPEEREAIRKKITEVMESAQKKHKRNSLTSVNDIIV